MRNVLLAIVLICPMMTYAVCNTPVSRTNFISNTKLDSSKLNSDLNNAYSRINELPGDCVTDGTVTSAKIKDNEIVNADIKTSAAIAMSKTNFAVAILKDVKSQGTPGGDCPSAGLGEALWNVRTLNTESDPENFVTLASNQFTLPIGTYLIEASVPGYGSQNFSSKIRNSTASSDALLGTSQGGNDFLRNSFSFISGTIEITGTTTFEVKHKCGTATTDGYGQPGTISSEVYTTVKITRIK